MALYRPHVDKFQTLSQRLADSICTYFNGSHPATLMNDIHPCYEMVQDMAAFYAENKTIPKLSLWSNQMDSRLEQPLFRKGNRKGITPGLLRLLGNHVKHADKDADEAVLLNEQMCDLYLFATVIDYILLKNALTKAGVLNAPKDSLTSRFIRSAIPHYLLSQVFTRITKQPYNTPYHNRTDALIGYFLDWRRILSGKKKLKIAGLDQQFVDEAVSHKISRKTESKIRTRINQVETFNIVIGAINFPIKLFEMIVKNNKPDDLRWYIEEEKRSATLTIMSRHIARHGLNYAAGGPEYWLNNVKISDNKGEFHESLGEHPMSTDWASPHYPEILKQFHQEDVPSFPLSNDPA